MLLVSLVSSLSFVASLSPEEADFFAGQLGRPMPSVVPLEEPVFSSIQFGPGDAPFVIFMNRDGGTYTCGDNDSRNNRSTIACGSSPATVGDWPGNDGEWSQFMACSVDLFSRFNVTITDVEPAGGDYVEAVIGGSPQQVGMGGGVGGVAPYQCGVIPRAVVYAFADVYYGGGNWWRDVCETAAQEVVHAFGLDHEFLCEDPMTYLSGCGEKTFQDVNAQCGEFQPRACDCTGATQNSVQEMLDLFGPAGPPVDDPVPPSVSLVSPGANAVLAANSEIEIVAQASDDLGIRSVVLEWDFNGNRMACPGTGDNFSCTQSGTTYTWTINVGEGARTYRVRATDVGQNDVATGDRTITLTAGGGDDVTPPPPPPPGEDDVPPSVVLGSPSNGAVLPSNQTIHVVATISDDISVASATLFWAFNGETYPCPHQSEYVQCTKSGAQFTWSLAVGAGSRTFHVAAADAAGNTALTTARTIELVDGATLPQDDAREDDDSIDTAGAVRCGDAHALQATDTDWFSLDVAAGMDVTVHAGALELLATSDGVDSLAHGNGTITFASPSSGRAFIATLPASANAGAYTLTIACTPSASPPPDGGAPPPTPTDPGAPADPDAATTPNGADAPRMTTSGGCAQMTPSTHAALGSIALLWCVVSWKSRRRPARVAGARA